MNDLVNHPPHYTQGPECECGRVIECIDVTQDMPFLEGNIIKYLWRWKHKNGVEDLKKARWYLDRLIRNSELPAAEPIPAQPSPKIQGYGYATPVSGSAST